VTDKQMLLPFEEEQLHGEYRNYFSTKRTNYFASIEGYPGLWNCYLRLDEIWTREFSDLEHIRDTGHVVPLMLFINSHAQYRIAFELGFSTCLAEAWNIMRSSMETVATAHRIHGEPNLARVWQDRTDGPAQKKAYKVAFEPDGKKSLFIATPALKELYVHYQRYSDWGTHPSTAAIAIRHSIHATEKGQHWMLNYLESDPKRIATFLFSMLNVCELAEGICFDCFKPRLELDDRLVRMRGDFCKRKNDIASSIIKQFNIPQ